MKNSKEQLFVLILALGILFLMVGSFIGFGLVKPKLANIEVDCGCEGQNLSGNFDYSNTLATFEGEKVAVPHLAFENNRVVVLGVANEERWIEVDLSEQKLKAWEGDSLFLETLVSTGLPWYPTPTGEFRIWIKLRATKMEGGEGKYYYYLPNVPYVMFFGSADVPNWRGYGLHGTYWHSDFGTQRSHGCINLPTEIAKELYYWTGPNLSEGKSVVWADDSNLGTRVVIHE